MFSYWPFNRSDGSDIGLRITVLARGEAEGHYSHPKANTTARGPVTGPVRKHQFHDIFILIGLSFSAFKVLKVDKIVS